MERLHLERTSPETKALLLNAFETMLGGMASEERLEVDAFADAFSLHINDVGEWLKYLQGMTQTEPSFAAREPLTALYMRLASVRQYASPASEHDMEEIADPLQAATEVLSSEDVALPAEAPMGALPYNPTRNMTEDEHERIREIIKQSGYGAPTIKQMQEEAAALSGDGVAQAGLNFKFLTRKIGAAMSGRDRVWSRTNIEVPASAREICGNDELARKRLVVAGAIFAVVAAIGAGTVLATCGSDSDDSPIDEIGQLPE